MKKILVILALMMGAICVMGQDVYESEIQSFGDYDMKGKTFYVISANPNISNNDLEFLDYKDYITQCLILKGAILCENSDSADVCILFDYGVGDKSYVANVAIPVWGITGSKVISTTSRYIGDGGVFQSSSVIRSISTGVTGILNQKENIQDYRRVINLYAYDNKDRTGDPVMLWKTNISSSGSSRDLQEVLPYIAHAAIPYMGQQTNGIKTFQVSPYKLEVFLIRNKYYLKKGLSLASEVKDDNLPLKAHSILQDEWSTTINIMARGLFHSPKYERLIYFVCKFDCRTYLVCNNQKYPIIGLYAPCDETYPNNPDLLGRRIVFHPGDNLIQMKFHTLLQKGDTFDIISYKNAKETKVLMHLKNIVVE
jgi:hypothetical protein